MKFIDTPNLPEKPVCLALVDGRISSAAGAALEQLGIRLLKTRFHKGLYEAVSCHPDMFINHIGGRLIVHAPGIGKDLETELAEAGFRLIRGDTELQPAYPRDIAYNAVRIGRFWFHNLRHTDPVLRRELEREGIEPVHVEQGYTKCSVALIDEKTIITADRGIARAAEGKGIRVLEIEPRQNILLPGLDYGFIGGSTGLVGKYRLAVNGYAPGLKSFEAINSLTLDINGEVLSLSALDVTDIGSILPLMTV